MPPLVHPFANKHICLTGGTDGIGLELAKILAKAGAKILVIGRRAKATATFPEGCYYHQADLSKAESPAQIAAHIRAIGWESLDHLIHNAGMGYVGDIDAQKPDNIESMIEANLKSPLALSQLLFPLLERSKGSVCFVGSTVKGRATPQFAVYTATKTGMADLARNLATEWSGRVSVQEVHPGPTRTHFHAKAGFDNPPMISLFMTPQEVAKGIYASLKSGKRTRNYPMSSLLFHAIKRKFEGQSA
ncbi:MAG: SDR family NAD(P)-dependent oxidoreductase [Hyphomicrobiales bacterium]